MSPDGKFILAADPRSGEAWVYPVEGGEPRPAPGVLPRDATAGWTREGSSVFVYQSGPPPLQVLRVNLLTGRREVWRTLAPADAAGVWAVVFISVIRDGRSYIYASQSTLSDLFMVKGLK